jgi:mercuric ion binding protein
MKNLVFIVFALLMSFSSSAQNKVDLVFGVSAACGMCEERIETAFDLKGVISADYDLETQLLHVVYKTKQFPDTLDIHRIAANVGHDTDKLKASDEVYNNLHSCCKYRVATHNCSGGDDHD